MATHGQCLPRHAGHELFTQGIDPQLDCSHINDLVRMAEYCNQLPVHPRHPYAGELVFTAFSGSHQDASTRVSSHEGFEPALWEVPYLPIDPMDLGRATKPCAHQFASGKGGVAYILEPNTALIARRLQIEFSRVIQALPIDEGVDLARAPVAQL